MVQDVGIYTVVHQPRRIKVPAQPIPEGASIADIVRCVFDERINKQHFQAVATSSYYPAAQMFLELARQGMHLSIGFSMSFLYQTQQWDTTLLDLFRELVAHKNVELIGEEPYHSILFLLDMPMFVARMGWMAEEMQRIFGKCPIVTDTTDMCLSATLYNALDAAGFQGVILNGNAAAMKWRENTHIYQYGNTLPVPRSGKYQEERTGDAPFLLPVHSGLSEDIGNRFSSTSWSEYPLYADTYAHWIEKTWGDCVFLGWNIETFGEYQHRDSGIFHFMKALPEEFKKRGIQTWTASELAQRNSRNHLHHLPLSLFPVSTGNEGMDFSSGDSGRRTLLQYMRSVYDVARLTKNTELLDMAIWMAQLDTIKTVQKERHDSSGAGHTSAKWGAYEKEQLLTELECVFANALHAMEAYLPSHLARHITTQEPSMEKTIPSLRRVELVHSGVRHSRVEATE